jgi:hypothetical protein
MEQPQIEISSIANIFSRQMHFLKAGDTELGHTHQFDHMTLLASGSLRVTIEGQTSEFKAPKMIFIHKDKVHELVALEDNTVAYCIHALRWGSGLNDIIDPACIPAGANPEDFSRSLIT